MMSIEHITFSNSFVVALPSRSVVLQSHWLSGLSFILSRVRAKYCQSTSCLVLSYTVLMNSYKSETAVHSCFFAPLDSFIWSSAALIIVFHLFIYICFLSSTSIYSLYQQGLLRLATSDEWVKITTD